MDQSDLKLAQQGDPGAISRLLNQALQPRGVTAKVLIKNQRLKILLLSSRPLAQQAFVQYLQRQLSGLGLTAVSTVRVYSQQTGADVPTWTEDFAILIRPTLPDIHPIDRPSPPDAPQSEFPPEPVEPESYPSIPRPESSADYPLPIDSRPLPAFNDLPEPAEAKPTSAIVHYELSDRGVWGTLRSFRLESIFPYKDVFSAALYRNSQVRFLLFLGLFPLIVNLVAEQGSLAQTAWLLGIYYALIWGFVLYNLIQPPEFAWGSTLKCTLFTTFIGIPTLLLFQRVPPFNTLYEAVGGGLLARLAGFVLGVGVLEELCKALPVYLFLLRAGKIRDPQTSSFYGATSGLGFAIAEGAAYSIRYAFGLSRGEIGLGSFVAANTIRFVSLPLFHAILAGIVGYFIGLAAINPSRQTMILAIGLSIAAVLHGLYNTFAGNLLGLVIIAFSILLFVAYLQRSRQIVDEMHQAEQRHGRSP